MDSEHESEASEMEIRADGRGLLQLHPVYAEDEKESVSVPLPSECIQSLRDDLIGDEREDEWVEIAGLDAAVYPATLWCLHAKSFEAAPECSLEKLQAAMA